MRDATRCQLQAWAGLKLVSRGDPDDCRRQSRGTHNTFCLFFPRLALLRLRVLRNSNTLFCPLSCRSEHTAWAGASGHCILAQVDSALMYVLLVSRISKTDRYLPCNTYYIVRIICTNG